MFLFRRSLRYAFGKKLLMKAADLKVDDFKNNEIIKS